MIEHGAIERFGRARQSACRAAVGIARARITARMVVRKDNSRAAMLGGVGDDRPQWKGRARFIAGIALDMNALRIVIDMRDPQALARGIAIGHAAGEEFPRRCQAVELQREFGTLIPHRLKASRSAARRLFETCPKRLSIMDRNLLV